MSLAVHVADGDNKGSLMLGGDIKVFAWQPHGSYSQGILSKSGKIRKKSEKVREFYIPKSGKTQRVREFKSTGVQKLTEMQKKNRTVAQRLRTTVSNFFLLVSLAD